MSVATIFTDIVSGLTAFLPALGTGIFNAFAGLFLTSGAETGAYTLNPLGSFAIAALVMAVSYKVLPYAYNFIVKRSRARKSRKARA